MRAVTKHVGAHAGFREQERVQSRAEKNKQTTKKHEPDPGVFPSEDVRGNPGGHAGDGCIGGLKSYSDYIFFYATLLPLPPSRPHLLHSPPSLLASACILTFFFVFVPVFVLP